MPARHHLTRSVAGWLALWQAFLAGLAVFFWPGFRTPALPRAWAYGALREVARKGMEVRTATWETLEGEHFVVRYRPGDESAASLVLETAEEVRLPVTRLLDAELPGRVLVVVYPDREALARSFGWPADEAVMGVYWAGVIRVLSPSAWAGGPDEARVFKQEGPMAHELAHLLVDYLAGGNYPRWLTEGIAQYVEREVTGFAFPTPAAGTEPYPLSRLDRSFDALPDQNMAYWQSLSFVEFAAGERGLAAWRDVLLDLGRGESLAAAVERELGRPLPVLERAFRRQVPVRLAS